MELTTADIIKLLGGKEAAKSALGVGKWAMYKWHENGIPPRHWRPIAERLNLAIDDVAKVRPAKAEAA